MRRDKKAKPMQAAAAECQPMRILAIESSCDESAVAVLDAKQGLLSHTLFSQIELHRVYGGVVPELASRDHVRRLLPLSSSRISVPGGTRMMTASELAPERSLPSPL